MNRLGSLRFLNPDTASDEEVIEAMRVEARQDFLMMMNNKTYRIWPDHLGFPNVFAWAVKNVFTPDEVAQIRFDHDDDAESFYKKNVPDPAGIVDLVRSKIREIQLLDNVTQK